MADAALIGRDAELRQVREQLALGRSVLLVGPAGVGKTAIVSLVATPELLVVDPFERVSAITAARIRRAMDHGRLVLAAARTRERQALGAVGRILWRMIVVPVRALNAHETCLVMTHRLQQAGFADEAPSSAWLHEAAIEAGGLPGQALQLVDLAIARRQTMGAWPSPGFALAVAHAEAWEHAGRPRGSR